MIPPTESLVHAGADHALSPMADAPLPVFTGAQMAKALTAYRDLQNALDRSMPEQIMQLDGKPFRKKGYWRAIAVAFGVAVEPVDERREIAGAFHDGRENFGYIVTYRATAPNGRTVTSDGTCFAVEKARRFKCPHLKPGSDRYTVHFPHHTCPDFDAEFQWRILPADATEHNVRGHAHTRAFNRAVSNLVGFGEVSAEEITRRDDDAQTESSAASHPSAPQRRTPPPAPPPPATSRGAPATTISEAQQKRFWAIARTAGWQAEEIKHWLLDTYDLATTADIPRAQYEEICAAVNAGTEAGTTR